MSGGKRREEERRGGESGKMERCEGGVGSEGGGVNKKKVRVLATGTFDILHPGHIRYLEEARKLGDELFVIVSRDANVTKRKRKPIIPEEQRLRVVSSLKVVDKAILGSERDMYEPLYSIKPDIIAIGYDQAFVESDLERELRERGINAKVVRIKKREECPLCKVEEIINRILKEEFVFLSEREKEGEMK